MPATKTAPRTRKASSARRLSLRSSKTTARRSNQTRTGRAAKGDDSSTVGKREVTIDRRRRGRRGEAEAPPECPAVAATVTLERRKKVNRRRQIDPTTCERDYSADEVEFMNAIDEYKRKSGRMFPTCSEVLEVVRELGYVKLSPAQQAGQVVEAPADCRTTDSSLAGAAG